VHPSETFRVIFATIEWRNFPWRDNCLLAITTHPIMKIRLTHRALTAGLFTSGVSAQETNSPPPVDNNIQPGSESHAPTLLLEIRQPRLKNRGLCGKAICETATTRPDLPAGNHTPIGSVHGLNQPVDGDVRWQATSKDQPLMFPVS
jgi:hypothetical protein